MTVSIEISEAINAFTTEVKAIVAGEAEQIAEDSADKLRISSPKATGKYAKGWKHQVVRTPAGITAIVYNASRPSLTHILEYGHMKRGGRGRVAAIPHIKKVEIEAAQEFERRVVERIEKG